MQLTIPFPPRELNPNNAKRAPWWPAHKAKIARTYKEEVGWICVAERVGRMKAPVRAAVTFHPPSRRKFNLDNLIAANKGAQDAVAERIGVLDEYWFHESAEGGPLYRMGEPVKGGCVVYELEEL